MAYWFNLLIEKERRRQEIVSAAAHRHRERLLSGAGSRLPERGGYLDDRGQQTADGNYFSRFQSRGEFARSHYERFLASLGALLVLWGRRLQNRYERLPETATLGTEELDLVPERNVDSTDRAR